MISVPVSHDYRAGDPVVFTEEGVGKLDSALTGGTAYTVMAVTPDSITVSLDGLTAITLAGDGGTGTADTPGAANHIKIDFAEFGSVCQVKQFSLELTREELDTTTLPCGIGSNAGGKYASFRTTQAGYASGTGSMTVMFTDDQASIANRLLANVLLKSQSGAEVKLYVNHVANAAGTAVDDDRSMFIQAPISITSMSVSVTPEDTTTGELSFSMSGQPTKLFGIEL